MEAPAGRDARMKARYRITARDRDAIVEDLEQVAARHSVAFGTVAKLAQTESRMRQHLSEIERGK
jgi:hypothetical protein